MRLPVSEGFASLGVMDQDHTSSSFLDDGGPGVASLMDMSAP